MIMGFGGGMLLWIVVLVIAIVIGARMLSAGTPRVQRAEKTSRTEALALLHRRFARGEIDEDEFLRRKAMLE